MAQDNDAQSGLLCAHRGECTGTRRETGVHIVLLLLVCGVLYFRGAGSLPLQDPDESRYALIVRQMVRTGVWVVPREGGKPYLDKPAPFYWLVAVGEMLTGSVERGGRGLAALSGMLTVLVSYFLARRIWGARAGLLAGVVLATMMQFIAVARWLRMDMPFEAAMWTGLWCFWRSRSGGCRGNRGTASWYGFYACCAVATLLKGPSGLVLPVLTVAGWLLLSGRPRRVRDLFHFRAILLYLLITVPWYLAAGVHEPGHAWEHLVRQNLARFTGHDFGPRGQGLLVCGLLLLGSLLPWIALLPGVFVRYFPRRWRLRAERPGVLFLWLAVLVPTLFFALSRSRRAYYFLPILPPLAVMTGALISGWVAGDGKTRSRWGVPAALLVTVLAAAAVPVAAQIWLGNVMDPWLAVPVAAGVVGLGGMCVSLYLGRRGLCVVWAAAVIVAVFLFGIEHVVPTAYEQVSARRLARLVDPAASRSATFCAWDRRRNSFEYYTDARLFLGFRHHRVGDLQRLVDLLASDDLVYCLVSSNRRLAELKRASRVDLFILGESAGQWLLTNRPPPGTGR